ncbi:nicotinamide mononucleotide adenylyltransferase [Sodiomyces alkalinus F11]|uniref:Nicotinamide-nucleotide adenylyltransferase n=1 Tax=Sodiomyces alkalinus (strain CBS 110278 / VKM F-3762 / F11) TaxID=1314773 RepID=A0A3N2PRP0_SODAK|nr:nicotinamide mononucleotide adenylyltransferase [Sodiomyces alkalinus F11]ROT37167.1 nicotinamide mononucleotide adenylyltransferase [Sodiomyces alkalinus F11]
MATDPGVLDAMTPPGYTFPTIRLRQQQNDPSRDPLVLVACGSFSPIHYVHLQMFAMAADYARNETNYEVVGAYLSPVSDAYGKRGLARAHHRVEMCELAVKHARQPLMVDPWEAQQASYVPTAKVLDHFDREINQLRGGSSGKKVRIALLAGADLVETFSQPNVWALHDLQHILGDYGAFVVERANSNIEQALSSLREWRDNIHYIPAIISNPMSSTMLRLLLKGNMSIEYHVPREVMDYIEANGLYKDEMVAAPDNKKAKSAEGSSS